MIRRMIEPKVLRFTFILVVFIWSLCGAQSTGKESPTAIEIVEAARSASIPSIGYQVTVSQKITGGKFGTTPLGEISHVGLARFVPGEGLERIESSDDQTTESIPGPKVLVDLGAFIEAMLSYRALTIDSVEIAARPHYRIQGQSKEGTQQCVIWVDSGNKCISRVEVYLMQKLFAEITIEYMKPFKGFWLPSAIDLHHATDDSRVTLEFSEYEFAE